MQCRRDTQLPLKMRGKGEKLMLDRRELTSATNERVKSRYLKDETINYRYQREGGSEVDVRQKRQSTTATNEREGQKLMLDRGINQLHLQTKGNGQKLMLCR